MKEQVRVANSMKKGGWEASISDFSEKNEELGTWIKKSHELEEETVGLRKELEASISDLSEKDEELGTWIKKSHELEEETVRLRKELEMAKEKEKSLLNNVKKLTIQNERAHLAEKKLEELRKKDDEPGGKTVWVEDQSTKIGASEVKSKSVTKSIED